MESLLSNPHQVTSPDQEILAWLTLAQIPNIGFIKLAKSAKVFSCSLLDLFSKSEKDLLSLGWNAQQIIALKQPSKVIHGQFAKTKTWLAQSKRHHFVAYNSPYFPSRLKSISRPPLFLFVKGDATLLSWPQVAFVGSRNPSIYATQSCYTIIQELSNYDHVATVSGMALGIDAACHLASLANSIPTLAVLGCGVDVVYPKRHKTLYSDIAKQGAVISEFPLGTKPLAHMFPRRNRIISGLSLGTAVLEARLKSGSLVTAKYAIEQNREVFALPNTIHNGNAKGCHWLIKQGAKLIESASDIVEELISITHVPEKLSDLQKNQKKCDQSLASDPLLDSVGYSATSVDLIAKRTGLALTKVLDTLLEYEMRGLITSTAEGYIKLRD